jgi:hypothetical protein
MPPKRPRHIAKPKKIKQTLLPGARPPTNDITPDIPAHLDPATRRVTTDPKPPEPKRWAWSWKHMPNEDPETRYINEITGVSEWRCAYCEKRYAASGGTGKVNEHLIEEHGLFTDAPRGIAVRGQVGYHQQSIGNGLKRQLELGEEFKFKRRKMGGGDGSSIDPNILELYYTRYAYSHASSPLKTVANGLRFITTCSQPLRLVEREEFRDLLDYINSDVLTWLPRSHNTVGKWVKRQYEAHKQRVKRNVAQAQSKIHISCDLWTSTNDLPILVIILHYVDQNGITRRNVAAMKEVDGAHTGENLSVPVLEVIKEWGIQANLGYFMMDNADNNNTMIKSIALGEGSCPWRF